MNSRDQPIRVMMKINPAIEREAVPKREAFELRRQVLRVGHRRVVDQHRNDGDAAF